MARWPRVSRDPISPTGLGVVPATPAETIALPRRVIALTVTEPQDTGDTPRLAARRYPINTPITNDAPTVARFFFGPPDAEGRGGLFTEPLRQGTATAEFWWGTTRYLQTVRIVTALGPTYEVNVGGTIQLTRNRIAGTPTLDPDEEDITLREVTYPESDPRHGRGDFTVTGATEGEAVITFGQESPLPAVVVRVLPAGTLKGDPPFILNPGDQSFAAGAAVDFTVRITDPDGDDLTKSVTGLPTGFSFTSVDVGVQITGTTGRDDPFSEHGITVSADDGINSPVTEDFTLTIRGPIQMGEYVFLNPTGQSSFRNFIAMSQGTALRTIPTSATLSQTPPTGLVPRLPNGFYATRTSSAGRHTFEFTDGAQRYPGSARIHRISGARLRSTTIREFTATSFPHTPIAGIRTGGSLPGSPSIATLQPGTGQRAGFLDLVFSTYGEVLVRHSDGTYEIFRCVQVT